MSIPVKTQVLLSEQTKPVFKLLHVKAYTEKGYPLGKIHISSNFSIN